MHNIFKKTVLSVLIGYVGAAAAFTFETESISGSFDSTVSLGTGIRAQSPSSNLVVNGASGNGAPIGNTTFQGVGDQGNINYGKGDAFTTYLKGMHELLLKLPDDWKFMGRFSWLRDFTATRTTGFVSAATGPNGYTASLSDDAKDDLEFKTRLLDLWVSKEFSMGEQRARVRVGNQVISWGESLFLPGGINQVNAMDIMRLSQPGTQLKEVFLPAPIVSFATGLGRGVNLEAYYQAKWDAHYFPPTGSYWSQLNGLGVGDSTYGINRRKAKDSGQFGAAVRWQPSGTQLNLGFYAMAYHDKAPNLAVDPNSTVFEWQYAEDRRMYGISANFPLGDWAIGTELSYRPKDAVSLNPGFDLCASNGGKCWVDEKKFQWHLTGLLSMTPGDYGGILKVLGNASTATFMIEAVASYYPKLKKFYGAEPIGAGVWAWGQEYNLGNSAEAVGDKLSWGYNLDFSWTYDGNLIPGWQVTPEIYYFQAVNGRTPNASALFMEGAKSANFIVSFTQNPAKWQAGVNYARFWGGSRVYDQPYADRDFFGVYVSRNF
ncbi:MAG: hypothetical protein H6R13_2913 [Proteobacteria bacterium]|nr:hypothetical protein [Pseudomonadota bacterium]